MPRSPSMNTGATGCSPVSVAFREGHDVVRPQRPNTIAKSLAIGNPADGPYALDVARRTGGAIADVSDEEIVAGIRLLAQTEGQQRRIDHPAITQDRHPPHHPRRAGDQQRQLVGVVVDVPGAAAPGHR